MPLLLIHPQTGDAFVAQKGDGRVVRALILDGYTPIGPRGQAAALRIRVQHAEQWACEQESQGASVWIDHTTGAYGFN